MTGHLAIPRNEPSLSGWLGKTLLFVVWLVALGTTAEAQTSETFRLTDDEGAWLAAHPVIRVAPAPNFPPMEFFDDEGVYRGVMADYMAILEARLGIKFEIARYDTWQDVVTATKAREVDVWMEAQDTPERREYLNTVGLNISIAPGEDSKLPPREPEFVTSSGVVSKMLMPETKKLRLSLN